MERYAKLAYALRDNNWMETDDFQLLVAVRAVQDLCAFLSEQSERRADVVIAEIAPWAVTKVTRLAASAGSRIPRQERPI